MSDLLELESDGRIAIPIILHFDGAIPSAGLDADEVAAVAEGMAKVVEFLAERATDGRRFQTLHLTAVRPGSATFQFLLEAVAVGQTVLPTIFQSGFTVSQIGDIFAEGIKLLKHLGGKPAQANVTTFVDGNSNSLVTNAQGATMNFFGPVYQIAGNAYFQDQAQKTIKPLKRKGRTLAMQQDTRKLLTTDSESYSAITARPINDNQPVTSNTIETTLRVRQPHLDSGDSWKFMWGKNRITAQVTDKAFMEKVTSREEKFQTGDLLRVKLRIEEQQNGKNVTKQHYIDEVLWKQSS